MDWLTFISKLVESLVWPAVALTALIMFRASLRGLLTGLRRLKWKDAEAEFSAEVKVLEVEAEKASLPQTSMAIPQIATQIQAAQDTLRRLSEIAPRAAILEAWHMVDRSVATKFREARGRDARSTLEHRDFIRDLVESGKVNPGIHTLYDRLRQLRNRAAHEDSMHISEQDALEYTTIAVRLMAIFQSLTDPK